ncbi:MAG: D-2-hydroxyacid dehydrogenase [Treponema sp.]|jgi:phosphoglycerate dehydrogenase-like enzyme|nr:D-2-hydroxyacid dehydrogenase [Treponema sp.]
MDTVDTNAHGIILLCLPPFRLLPEFRELLLKAGDGRDVVVSMDRAEITSVLNRVEIGMGDVPFDLLPAMPRLKWLQLWSAGADFLQRFPEAKALPFQLTITTGIHGQQMAEHFFTLLLAWTRRLPQALAAQQNHKWLFIQDHDLITLNGKTMLIAGYGTIGRHIARIGQAFGMKVIGLRRNVPQADHAGGVQIEIFSKLKELLPQAGYVVNVLPSTAETRRVFSAAEFGAMRPDALYISLGRGATTDQAALTEALCRKHIAGALLDVFECEPLPPDSPLWALENVLITGHYAGCHPGYTKMAMAVALENLDRYKRGEPLNNVVDKRQGY